MAKRFRFRLEVVRKLREQVRDAQRRVVADVARAVSGVEGRVDRLGAELRGTLDRTRDHQQVERLDVPSLRAHQYYQSFLHRRIIEAGIELEEKKRRLSTERTKLGEASARLKAIEKLRERRWQRHLFHVRREERADSDESALQLYQRKTVLSRAYEERSDDGSNVGSTRERSAKIEEGVRR